MIRMRTGYSFRVAVGTIEDSLGRILETKVKYAPITDRASTFGFTHWDKAARKAGLKPVFGVELAVVEDCGDRSRRVNTDYWTFIAKDNLIGLNELVGLATSQSHYQPRLNYTQAMKAKGVIKIVGSNPIARLIKPTEDLYVGLAPSTPIGLIKDLYQRKFKFIAAYDNYYPTEDKKSLYEVIVGRSASIQSYPQHILSEEEWYDEIGWRTDEDMPELTKQAYDNYLKVCEKSKAILPQGKLVRPQQKNLRKLCVDGAKRLGVNLKDKAYAVRLDRELKMIREKGYGDYFLIVSDIVSMARSIMVVGPARGSSCGSLVCYLLNITTIDPLKHDLLFERFIDVNRNDMPDIDIDFQDDKRQLVFDYVAKKYGKERVARLGTVNKYAPRSALHEVMGAFAIVPFLIDRVNEAILKRSSGDARALDTLADTLDTSEAGAALMKAHPEARIACLMEGHPRHSGQHAAGILITDRPVAEYVAVDARNGATMCDKKDAETLGLLKIDALGLTQLSVLARTLELAGEPRDRLDNLPLDDVRCFEIINQRKFAGIFQFMGQALQSVCKPIKVDNFHDFAAISALARPGPLVSGGAAKWISRKNGAEQTYPHELFRPYLEKTLGVVVYQEQIMQIAREIGGMSWQDVTKLRQSMSRSLGKEYFDQFGDRFKAGAEKKGIPRHILDPLWNDLCAFGSWAFNLCLSGDTKIAVLSTGSHHRKEMKVSELYELYYGKNKLTKQAVKPMLMSLFDGKGIKQRLLRIFKNGIKQCYKFSFDDGTSVTCTSDHKFLINDEWKRAGDSNLDDKWSQLTKPSKIAKEGKGKGHAKGKRWGDIKSNGRKGKTNVAYIDGRGLRGLQVGKFRERMKNKECIDCKKKNKRMEVHHNDFSEGKINPNDMAWLCPGCHKLRHYKKGRVAKDGIKQIISYKTLTRIDYVGNKQTYDIEMGEHHNFKLANGLVTHNSHSIAYGLVSYQCCYAKVNWPYEFAAASLDVESDPSQMIKMLRELAKENIGYIPVDRELSEDRWKVANVNGEKKLIGPLSMVNMIGPKMVEAIMGSKGPKPTTKFPPRAEKLLVNPRTPIDSLWPIRDAFERVLPMFQEKNDVKFESLPREIESITNSDNNRTVVFYCILEKINLRDLNEEINVAKRNGRKATGQTSYLNLLLKDDTGTMFGRINHDAYIKLGRPIVERGAPGKHLYAIKGKIKASDDFTMMWIERVIHIGHINVEREQEAA